MMWFEEDLAAMLLQAEHLHSGFFVCSQAIFVASFDKEHNHTYLNSIFQTDKIKTLE